MNDALVFAAKQALALSGGVTNKDMVLQVYTLLTKQAELPPDEFKQKARKLPVLARAALLATITELAKHNEIERPRYRQLAEVLE